MKGFLFIVNPNSGKGKIDQVMVMIEREMNTSGQEYKIISTEYRDHAFEIAQSHLESQKTIVAVGGDGTINEVSKALVYKDNLFGVIPMGSGNGLARSLGIPLTPLKALKRIIRKENIKIDSGLINDYHFINMAGIGFDALVAHAFDKQDTRGFKTYFKTVLKEIKNIKPAKVVINLDETQEFNSEPFMISIANSSQWGNGFHISPFSKLNDGMLDVCILDKFPLMLSPMLAIRSKMKNIHKSKYMHIISTQHGSISTENKIMGHVDGEPVEFEKTIKFGIVKSAINIII